MKRFLLGVTIFFPSCPRNWKSGKWWSGGIMTSVRNQRQRPNELSFSKPSFLATHFFRILMSRQASSCNKYPDDDHIASSLWLSLSPFHSSVLDQNAFRNKQSEMVFEPSCCLVCWWWNNVVLLHFSFSLAYNSISFSAPDFKYILKGKREVKMQTTLKTGKASLFWLGCPVYQSKGFRSNAQIYRISDCLSRRMACKSCNNATHIEQAIENRGLWWSLQQPSCLLPSSSSSSA